MTQGLRLCDKAMERYAMNVRCMKYSSYISSFSMYPAGFMNAISKLEKFVIKIRYAITYVAFIVKCF